MEDMVQLAERTYYELIHYRKSWPVFKLYVCFLSSEDCQRYLTQQEGEKQKSMNFLSSNVLPHFAIVIQCNETKHKKKIKQFSENTQIS